MDPANLQRALSAQGATTGQHEQGLQITHQAVSLLAQSGAGAANGASRRARSSGSPSLRVGVNRTWGDAPFEGDLNRYQGFLLQCRDVFSQLASLLLSDQSKIQDIIGLLWGCALAWEQASLQTRPESMTLKDFLRRFKRVFDWLNLVAGAGDKLFTISQGTCSVTTSFNLRPWSGSPGDLSSGLK